MTDYRTYLASRKYERAIVVRTEKMPGDVILGNASMPAERVPAKPNVVKIGKRRTA